MTYDHAASVAKDRDEAREYADAFIELVNADHDDHFIMGRDTGCRIRDHIEYLRRQLAALQWQPITEGNLPKDREIVLVHGEGYYYVCVYRENLHSFQTREGREIYPSRFKSINPPAQEPK